MATTSVKNIILLGTGGSLNKCDFNIKAGKKIPDSEIWGVNGAYTVFNIMPEKLKPAFSMDKIFMADTLFSHETGSLNFDIEQMNEFAKHHNCTMYSLHRMKLGKHVLNARRYPYQKIVDFFGTDYFTDTICYMIAYALWKHGQLAQCYGVTRPELKRPLVFRLFGVDMANTREYSQSKGGVEFWIGIARGMGAQIEVSQGSTILAYPLGIPYGKWEEYRKLDMKTLDPFGLMKDKNLSTAQMEAICEQRNRDSVTEQS